MEKNALRKEISSLIDSIKEHSDMITPHERISQLELEMILSKIKRLYEKSIVFNYICEFEDGEKKASSFEKENTAQKPEHLPQIENSQTTAQADNIKHQEKDSFVRINETEKKTIDSITSSKEDFNKDITTKETISTKDINSKLKESAKSSVYDHLSKNENILSEQLKKKPISDLSGAIGINEKILFTRELFKGDGTKFHETITLLNSFSSVSQAEEYIHQNIIPTYHWDLKSISVLNFMKLIERRYI